MKKIVEAWAEAHSCNPALPGYHIRLLYHGEILNWMNGFTTTDKKSSIHKDHLWHIGSCAKSMTGSLVHSLVRSRRVKYQDEVLPGVSLCNLLTHRSGIPNTYPSAVWEERITSDLSPFENRSFIFDYWSKQDIRKSSLFQYSNWNYILAAHYLERIFGFEFETLIEEEMFKPLGISRYEWGAPGKLEPQSAIWGHRACGANLKSVEPSIAADNPPFFAPAGGLSLSLDDWSVFMKAYQNTLRTLDIVPKTKIGDNQNYLCLGVFETTLEKERVYHHNGSNTYWYSAFTLIPAHHCFWMIATNSGTPNAQMAIEELNSLLTKKAISADKNRIS